MVERFVIYTPVSDNEAAHRPKIGFEHIRIDAVRRHRRLNDGIGKSVGNRRVTRLTSPAVTGCGVFVASGLAAFANYGHRAAN
jgi:hypothetical protein